MANMNKENKDTKTTEELETKTTVETVTETETELVVPTKVKFRTGLKVGIGILGSAVMFGLGWMAKSLIGAHVDDDDDASPVESTCIESDESTVE